MKKLLYLPFICVAAILLQNCNAGTADKKAEADADTIPAAKERTIWTKEEANAWYAKQAWLVGCDFLPSTAINQLEMWQAETFDTTTISRELGWAAAIGMNTVRVYLHDLLYQQDSVGFLQRMDVFLQIAAKQFLWRQHPKCSEP